MFFIWQFVVSVCNRSARMGDTSTSEIEAWNSQSKSWSRTLKDYSESWSNSEQSISCLTAFDDSTLFLGLSDVSWSIWNPLVHPLGQTWSNFWRLKHVCFYLQMSERLCLSSLEARPFLSESGVEILRNGFTCLTLGRKSCVISLPSIRSYQGSSKLKLYSSKNVQSASLPQLASPSRPNRYVIRFKWAILLRWLCYTELNSCW